MAFSTYNNINSGSYRTSTFQNQTNFTHASNNPPPPLYESYSTTNDISNIHKIVTFSDLNKSQQRMKDNTSDSQSTYSHTYHTHTSTAPNMSISTPYSNNTMSGYSGSGYSGSGHSHSATVNTHISIPSLKSHQSSKSFGKNSSNLNNLELIPTPTHTINWNELISQCPSMVMNKCKCKHILKQNKEASKLWSSCYRINVSNINYEIDNREIEIAYFDGLHSKLNEYFQCKVNSQRIPNKKQISESIIRFGGFVISENNDIVIDRCHFITFWKWYRGICNIIKDNKNLWDTKFPFQMDLFVDRQVAQYILERAPPGTFVLRISRAQTNGVVISYSEPSFNRTILIRHLLLIRHGIDNYETKTNHKTKKATSLNLLIRNFIKLKFCFTPKLIYEKKHVF